MLAGTLLALATAGIWGVGDFLSRKPSAKIGSMLTSALIQPIGLVLMIPILFAGGISSTLSANTSMWYLLLNLGTGVVAFFGILFLYRGYSEGIMSIVAPIAGAFPVIAVILSVVLLGTVLTPIRSLSIIAVIIGITLAGVKLSSFWRANSPDVNEVLDRQKIIRGADDGVGAMICAGFGLFSMGVVAPIIGSILAVVILKSGESITALGAILSGRIKLARPGRSTLAWVLLVGACDAGGFATYNLAIASAGGSLPIVVTLAGLLGVVTVALARIFYKEKLEKIQLVGVVIIFAAVAAILYF
ncbi:MAG TPA: DMT family transporter [Nitrososphaerales archaeon]|nr:DMT family transporter [Nitrososphaerales archaeon]